jgi:hypothetical protein
MWFYYQKGLKRAKWAEHWQFKISVLPNTLLLRFYPMLPMILLAASTVDFIHALAHLAPLDQSCIELQLEDKITINHNTDKFRTVNSKLEKDFKIH